MNETENFLKPFQPKRESVCTLRSITDCIAVIVIVADAFVIIIIIIIIIIIVIVVTAFIIKWRGPA